jgi:putative salt-induced outer membrane protein YdiY
MVIRTIRILAAVAAVSLAQPVLADAAKVFAANPAFPSTPAGVTERPQGEWLGQLAIGFNSTTGNTETTSLSTRLLLGYERTDWRHVVNLIGNRASDATGTISERYQLTGKTDYKINEHDYLFVTALGERDRFAGIATPRRNRGGQHVSRAVVATLSGRTATLWHVVHGS